MSRSAMRMMMCCPLWARPTGMFVGSVDTVWAGFAAVGGPRAGVQSLWRVNRGHGWENLSARPLGQQVDSTTI